MATEDGDRATVALVSAKIDGLKELFTRGFLDIQRQLDTLSDMPVKVAKLEGENRDIEHRVTRIEKERDSSTEWKRGPLVLAAVAGLSALLNLLIAGGAIHV